MEANKNLTKAFTSGSQDMLAEEMDPSVITMFLDTCMKLICDSKVMKGLQEPINMCTGKKTATNGLHVVINIGKHKARTGHEMRHIA